VKLVNGTLTVTQAGSTTQLSSSNTSVVVGTPVTFTASVLSATTGIPTGSIQFFDGSTALGTVALNQSVATLTTSSLSVGSHSITASYGGDTDFVRSLSSAVSQQVVARPQLIVTASDAGRAFGANNPQFIVTVTGAVNGDSFVSSASTSAIASSPPGQYAIVPSISGANISNYTVKLVNGTLTVTQAGSTTQLASSNTSVSLGLPVTFTASVLPATTGTPTGSIQFFDGSTTLGTVPLNAQSAATLTTSSLTAGSHSITASYGGDTDFVSSLTSAVSLQVVAQPDFGVTSSPASATIKAGASATFTFTVTPVDGFNQAVNFSCSGLPALSQCSFVPASLTPNGSPVTSVLTISTTAPSTASAVPLQLPTTPGLSWRLYSSLFGTMLGMTGLMLALRRRSLVGVVRLWLGAAVLCLLAVLTSCGGGNAGGGNPTPTPTPQAGTPQGTSQITVSASSGNSSKTAAVTLTVQ
jgi:hypothetical protein